MTRQQERTIESFIADRLVQKYGNAAIINRTEETKDHFEVIENLSEAAIGQNLADWFYSLGFIGLQPHQMEEWNQAWNDLAKELKA